MKDHPTDAYVQFGFQQFGSFRKRWLFFFHFWLVVHHSFKAFKKYIVYELIFFFLFFSVFSHHKILLATIIYQNLILVMVSIIPHIKHNFFLRRLYSDNKILWPKIFIKSITTSPNNNQQIYRIQVLHFSFLLVLFFSFSFSLSSSSVFSE